MKTNPFAKYIKGETAMHIAVAQYLQYQYPNTMFHHSPNEAKRTPFERYLISQMGVSAGFPDFVIFYGNAILALELKYKDNIPTESQMKWLSKFYSNSFVCWTFESAKQVIDSFLNPSFRLNDYLIPISDNNGIYLVLKSDKLPAKIKELIEL